MAQDSLARYTLRVDPTLLARFHYVAKYHGRSTNKEIELLMKQHIQRFEKSVEPIPELDPAKE